jgi:hypothetical protein
MDAAAGSGSLRYNYKAKVDGVEHTYAWVTFAWNKEGLKAEFQAEVDETRITPELNMPVECHLERSEGMITGVADCYLAFGDKRFHAPAGLPYRGTATSSTDASKQEVYQVTLQDAGSAIVEKRYLPEL